MPFDPETAQPFNPAQAQPVQQQQQAAPAAPGPQPGDGTDAMSMVKDAGQMLYAALHGAADTGTFGLADKGSAALASLISPMTGKSMNYDEALARVRANTSKLAQDNPISAGVGDAAGMVLGAGKLAQVAKAVPMLARGAEMLQPVAKAPITNVLKSALGGGAAAGGYTAADEAIRNGSVNPDDVLLSTATGAVLAPPVTKIGTMLARGVQNASTKAMTLLANKLGETPDVLQNAYNNFKAATGRLPTMAEIVQMKSQGELRQLAQNNPIVQEGVNAAEDTANAQRPRALSQAVEDNSGGPVQDINQLTQARKERMTQAMDPIRGNKVIVSQADAGLLTDPRVQSAIRRDPDLRGTVNDALQEIDDNGHSSLLTVNDMDNIRRSLRGEQTAALNPANPRHNPHVAAGYGNAADNIADLATGGDPAHPYAQALQQFEQDSNYIKGFKHGMAGKAVGEAADPDLIGSLNEPEGQSGYQSGIASRTALAAAKSPGDAISTADKLAAGTGDSANLRGSIGEPSFQKVQAAADAESKGASALNAISGRVNPEEPGFSGHQAAQAAAGAVSHSAPTLLYHAARAIPSFTKQSPAVQTQIVKYLANPSMTQQGINLLRKAGAKDDEIRKLAVALSVSTGANAANTLGQ